MTGLRLICFHTGTTALNLSRHYTEKLHVNMITFESVWLYTTLPDPQSESICKYSKATSGDWGYWWCFHHATGLKPVKNNCPTWGRRVSNDSNENTKLKKWQYLQTIVCKHSVNTANKMNIVFLHLGICQGQSPVVQFRTMFAVHLTKQLFFKLYLEKS